MSELNKYNSTNISNISCFCNLFDENIYDTIYRMIEAVILDIENESQITFRIQIMPFGKNTIKSNNKYNIYYTKCMTCRDIAITNTLNIYYTRNYTYYNIDTSMSNIKGDTCSYAERSRYYINFINIAGNIYCIGLLPCWTGSITNVNGSVFAFDGMILSDNPISNINDKLIAGWYGLEGSTIQKEKNIYVTESNVIRNTKIISEVDIHAIFSITIDADMGIIYCNVSNICRLDCEADDADSYLTLHCFGMCCQCHNTASTREPTAKIRSEPAELNGYSMCSTRLDDIECCRRGDEIGL